MKPIPSRACAALIAVLAAFPLATLPVQANDSTEAVEVPPSETEAQKKKRKKALKAADQAALKNPERHARLLPPGSSLNPKATPITYTLRGGGTRQTLQESLLHTKIGLGHAELKWNDRGHVGRLYSMLWNLMPPAYRGDLPRPEDVKPLPIAAMQARLVQLGDALRVNMVPIRRDISVTAGLPAGLLVNPISDCTNETGHEVAGSDSETSARCAILDYAALGLMRNLDWALKGDLTCVKDQGGRGTCSVHAIAANVESTIQTMGGDPENLNEQDLYFWGKIGTDWAGRYTDGLAADEMYDMLDAENLPIQYESVWNYNRSPGRGAFASATNSFPNSCGTNYAGEMCTDFAFQAQELNAGGVWVYTIPSTRSATGWEVLDWTSIPDLTAAGLPDWQIDVAILAVEADYPVHLSFNTAASFRTPDANGYVQYDPADPAPTGAHAILAVGFVADRDLPAGVPNDPDGRGYFVIKNSWGTDYGDCGFAYLSTEFVRQWAYGFRYLEKTLAFR